MNQNIEKIFKGCGCLSIGGVAMMILLGIIGTCVGDKDGETEEMVKTALAETEKKDSVVVNEPLEGDPYKELDDLIGLGSVKTEVRSFQKSGGKWGHSLLFSVPLTCGFR